ncbi:MAG TPA: hypothetical protein VH989_08800 [Actinomycetota bacterium]
MLRTRKHVGLGGLVVVLALVATACGSSASAGGGGASLTIAEPMDGATVPSTFTVRVDSSVPLGPPSTGDDHVHLCFDGASCDTEYKLVYGNTFQVSGLTPGQHTIQASLRNADHSAAGPTDSITVTVEGSASSGSMSTNNGTPTPSPSSGGGHYGY